MSRTAAALYPIGPVRMFWNDVRFGSPKTQANIRYTKEGVTQKDEESGQDILQHKTGEVCEVDVVVAGFSSAQMRYAYDQATGYATPSTINTVNYESAGTEIIRYTETHKLSGTANITVDSAGFVDGSVNVFKTDFSNAPDGYVSATDFTSVAAAGTVARKTGGDIADGETVFIDYNHTSTASVNHSGGELSDFEAPLRLVHTLDDGKTLQFYGYRAKKIGASDVAIQMAAEFSGIAMTFKLLAKLDEAPGKQLFKWSKEA